MKKLILLALPLLFVAQSCHTDNSVSTGNLNLKFKPTFNAKPFVINQIYTINGKNVRFTRFQIYTTRYCSSATADCSNAVFVNFTSLDDSTKAAKGLSSQLSFTAANYTTLDIGLGVDAKSNAKTPKDYTSTNPLSSYDDYWADWNSYIFFKLEGLMDKDGDGKFETGISLHTGSNECFRSFTLNKTFSVPDNGSVDLNFEVNLNTILRGWDLVATPNTNSLSDKPKMNILMDNVKDAFSAK